MPDLRKGDVVVTMFPFADGTMAKIRPAMVCARPHVVGGFAVCWVLMITSASRRQWPGDIEISDLAAAGLPGASLIRTLKIACIDTRAIAQKLGVLDAKTRRAAEKNLRTHLSA